MSTEKGLIETIHSIDVNQRLAAQEIAEIRKTQDKHTEKLEKVEKRQQAGRVALVVMGAVLASLGWFIDHIQQLKAAMKLF